VCLFSFHVSQNLCVMEEEEFGKVVIVCSFFILCEVSQRSFCHDVCKDFIARKSWRRL